MSDPPLRHGRPGEPVSAGATSAHQPPPPAAVAGDTPATSNPLERLAAVVLRVLDVPVAVVLLRTAAGGTTVVGQSRAAALLAAAPELAEHALLGSELLLVPDALEDVRFAALPHVRGHPRIRFFAGQPLTGPDGSVAGVLAIMDRRARKLKESEITLLGELARLAEAELASASSAGSAAAILDGSPSPLVGLSAQGRVVAWGEAASRLLGIERARALGRPLAELLGIPDAELEAGAELAQLLAPAAPAGEPIQVRLLARRPDGSRLELLAVGNGARPGDPGPLWVALNDRGARRPAEEELERLGRFFAVVPDLFCVAGPDLRVLGANAAWERTLGVHPDDLRGRPLLEHVHPEDRGLAASLFADLASTAESSTFELRHVRRDGEVLTLLWTAAGFEAPRLVYGLARDITERKKIDSVKNEFVSIVSHELRTPLTSILGSLGLVAGGIAGELPPPAMEMVRIAQKNGERLVRLINDILDIEKIESGAIALHLEPVAIAPLLAQAIEANRAYGDRFGVSYALEGDVASLAVRGDPDRIIQVVTNLLSNATKFSPRGETVVLRAERQVASGVRVSVIDRGPGIPEAFRGSVFRRFAQADSSDARLKGGTGLGLSIAKAIVERHGGRIGFETEMGAGTTFWFELPECVAEDRSRGDEPGSGPVVLVCEDDPDVATLLVMTLERGGFRADVAATLAEARERLAGRTYAAMTLDLALPDGDGHALFEELRRDERNRTLPVIVVSAQLDALGQYASVRGVGPVERIAKPIDPKRLVATVERLIRQRRRTRPRILHVEADADVHQVVAMILQSTADVVHAPTLETALAEARRSRFDLLLVEPVLPDGSGVELLKLENGRPPAPAVLFSVREVEYRNLPGVAAALVKSRASNQELLETVRALLADPSRSAPPEDAARSAPPEDAASDAASKDAAREGE